MQHIFSFGWGFLLFLFRGSFLCFCVCESFLFVLFLPCRRTFQTNSDKNLFLNTDYVSNYIRFLICIKLVRIPVTLVNCSRLS